jgi:hypothetical protein
MNDRARELRAFARTILERATAFDWSLQGFGMFRLYLSRWLRLHVWDSRFAVPSVTTAHTHPWHFHSTVLAGCITDRLFEVHSRDAAPDAAAVDVTHMRQRIVCGPGGGVCQNVAPEPVRLSLLQAVEVPAGKSYSLTAEAAHETLYLDGTVTLIEREFLPDTEHAYVFYPAGQEWVSAEPRRASVREVMQMALAALGRMEEAS